VVRCSTMTAVLSDVIRITAERLGGVGPWVAST
jgi:hypothetical protein